MIELKIASPMHQDCSAEYSVLLDKEYTIEDFLSDCDNWLRQIGFYNHYGDESTWEYKIDIKNVVKFEQPIDVNKFQLLNGTYLKTAPTNFCYIKENNF